MMYFWRLVGSESEHSPVARTSRRIGPIVRALAPVAAAGVILGMAACGGDDDDAEATVDAGAPLGDGVVKEVAGSLAPADGVAEGKGQLLLDVFHSDRAVNRKVKIGLSKDPAGNTPAAKGEGNQAFVLDPGEYYAKITYKESELVGNMIGGISGLKVNDGQSTKYNVVLEAPVGLLHMKFNRSDGSGRTPVKADEQVQLMVYPAGGDRSAPVYEGPAGNSIALPAGTWDVKATYDDGKQMPTTEWYQGIEIAPAMAKTKREILLGPDASGVRIDAFNFSRDVNAASSVYFFNPGARVELGAQAKASGKGGEVIPVPPGVYDVLLVYQPSPDDPDLTGRKLLREFKVPERGGVRRQVDVGMELGVLRIKILEGKEDVSERADLRVKRAGADAVASTSILDAIGVGEHWVKAGTYDIYMTYKPASGEKVERSFFEVVLGNGYVWEQTFTGTDAWVPVACKVPAEMLRAVDWRPPGDDDDSAGDDDDSAGADEPEGSARP